MMKADPIPDSCSDCEHQNPQCGQFYGSLNCIYSEQIVQICCEIMNREEEV